MALIRYPGSKEKLVKKIIGSFPDQMKHELFSLSHQWEYREPFFGAGAVGFEVLKNLHRSVAVWLNDKDPGIVALWRSVWKQPQELCELISKFRPTREAFYAMKEIDGTGSCDLTTGFRKLALHRISFSGLGYKAGGPIGGKKQTSAYNVDCRWNPERMKRDVVRLSKRLNWFERMNITCGDCESLIADAPETCFIYLDPPYYEKGEQLYRYAMQDADHVRLSGLLRTCRAQWVLSYDDHSRIRELYEGRHIEPVHLKYTCATTSTTRPKNQEILIHAKAS